MAVIQYDSPQDPYGIINAGNILAQTLMGTAQQRGQERRQEEFDIRKQQREKQLASQLSQKSGTILQEVFSNIPQNPSLQDLQKASAQYMKEGGDPSILKPFLSLYEPYIKEQTRAQGIQAAEQKISKKPNTGPVIAQESAETITPEGVTFEGEESLIEGAPKDEQGKPVGWDKIYEYMSSSYEELRRKGEGYQRQMLEAENRLAKENAAVRKEWRQEIKDYVKPYKNESELKQIENRFKKAEELIETKKVSVDENWMRNIAQAYFEGTPLKQFLQTAEQQELWALLRPALQSKEIGGSNPSTVEVLLAKSTLPGEYNLQLSNEFIIRKLLNDAQINRERSKVIREERERIGMGNISPSAFETRVENRMRDFIDKKEQEFNDYTKKREIEFNLKGKTPKKGYQFMLTPKGDIAEVPVNKVKEAESFGGVKLNAAR